jgi:sarcosine oxidase subunit gamma
LAEVDLGQITSIAPYDVAGLGPAFPAPNCVLAQAAGRLVWTGRGQAFLIGGPAGEWSEIAAVTDQSDAWACLSLTGDGAAEVLARLVPLDLRAMAIGSSARSALGHMGMILIGVEGGFQLMVFRSMAKTAWHEIEVAMKMRAARLAC